MRIVFADDSGVVRNVLRALLRSTEHEVVGVAENGKEAVALCEEMRPDAVLLDIIMPEMTGYEAAKIIRAAGTAKYIVLLTSQNNFTTTKLAEEVHAFVLRKMVHYVEEIQNALKKAVALVDAA